MRLPYPKAKVIAVFAVMLLAACSSQSAPKVSPPSPVARQGNLAGSAVPLVLASKTQASLFGTPPVRVTPTHLAMATRSIGWAAGEGLGDQAQSYLALATSDGGATFQVLFTAPAPIVAVAAPDARHAFFLEEQCANGGYCTSILQEWRGGDEAPQTLWRGNTDAAVALAFPTAQTGFFTVADMTSPDDTIHLFTTVDAGRTFTEHPQPCGTWNPSAPGPMYFSNASTGWLVCNGNIAGTEGQVQAKSLYTTRDAGRHWSLIASSPADGRRGALPPPGFADTLIFTSPQVGYVGIGGYGIYRTQDGGRTWRKVFASADPPGGWALSIGFLPGGFGWFLGGRGPALQETDNGGSAWHEVGTTAPLVPERSAWDLGGGLAIALAPPSVSPRSQGRAQLVLSSDGGGTWAKLTDLALPGYTQSLSATSPYDLTVGENLTNQSFVANSSNLGRTWSRVRLPKDWQVWALGYWRPADGWVVADHQNTNGIFRCGQRSCTRVPTPFSLLWAQMTGPSSGFAVGQDVSGRWILYSTQNDGRIWTGRVLPGEFNVGGTGAKGHLAWLYQVDDYPAEPDPPHPLYGGTMALVSPDRGRTWREITLPAGLQAVVSLSFANASHGLLVTSSPVTGTSCWSTSDGGHIFRLLP